VNVVNGEVTVERAYGRGPSGQMHVRIARPAKPTARPLVCFHMSPYSGALYDGFLPAMAEDRIVLAPDTPGFGMSDPPRERPCIADYARAHAALIESLGHDSFDVLGYHTGANIAVEIAALFPNRVAHVAMIGAPLFTAEETPQRRAMFGPVKIEEDGSHMPPLWTKSMRWGMEGRTKEMLAALFHERLRRPDISWWGHSAVYDHPLAERMKLLHQPVALFNPHDDIQSFTERGRALLKPSDRFLDLPGWSHGFLDLKTGEFVALMRGFLAAQ
jgi:pimeloyl-ACP methyl ester carboxylesterase